MINGRKEPDEKYNFAQNLILMSQGKKIWLGFLSFLPVLLTVAFLIYLFASFIPEMIRLEHLESDDEQAIYFLSRFLPFFIFVILSSITLLALKIYFIFHAVSNKDVKPEERIVWILLFVFIGSVTYPVYWMIRILQKAAPESNFIRA